MASPGVASLPSDFISDELGLERLLESRKLGGILRQSQWRVKGGLLLSSGEAENERFSSKVTRRN